MNLVRQEKLGECGAACVAMVAGITLGEARSQLPDLPGGVIPQDVITALQRHGVESIESMVRPSPSVPAILSVPALNVAGLLHFIVWDGERYLDPGLGDRLYPVDGAVVRGVLLPPQWVTAILILKS